MLYDQCCSNNLKRPKHLIREAGKALENVSMFVDFVEKDVRYHWYPWRINYCRRNEYSSDEVDDDWKRHFCFFSWSNNAKAIFSEIDQVCVYRLMIELWLVDRATRKQTRVLEQSRRMILLD